VIVFEEHLPMADPITAPDARSFDRFIQAQGKALRVGDPLPPSRLQWEQRRKALRESLLAALGSFPEKPCPLEPGDMGMLKRPGYRIEKLLLQTRPETWMTCSLYVPDPLPKKTVPAVLAVHGHWGGARRDPVVQARCLGLVKLGFIVLAVDAFGAGERHPQSQRGGYHGALIGSTLWPSGLTLAGVQVYENRRAVDYLLTRPEVDPDRLGISGASGGGNQTMYAGALDERFKAVVPVCSVGTYQAYLKAACCVCEVAPGALRFTEEGDVLATVAPRALMVVNATQDAFQFSVGEAEKSVARAREVFKLYKAEDRLHHATFESPHAYNQPMREAMYGWMTRWLKEEGDGKPILEPKHDLDTLEDLSCFAEGKRPSPYVFPPTLAAADAARVLKPLRDRLPDHREAWEAIALQRGATLARVLGEFPKAPRTLSQPGDSKREDGVTTTPFLLASEPELALPFTARFRSARGKMPACVLLHLDGRSAALKHPLAAAFVDQGFSVLAPDLRATGDSKPAGDAIGDAPDHNSAEHALWIGRPLLGQWVFDVQTLLDWIALQPGLQKDRVVVCGLGQAGLLALVAAVRLRERIAAVALSDAPVSMVTDQAYPAGTRMGLLAPGLLEAGDVPHLAAMVAPRPLLALGGYTLAGGKRTEAQLRDAFAFTAHVYRLLKVESRLRVSEKEQPAEAAKWLLSGLPAVP
jgi:dienelactone hydrolase